MALKFSENGNAIVTYLKISNDALTQIKFLLKNRKEKCDGIRVGIRTRGCSGLSYTIEYAVINQNITKYDDLVVCKNNEEEIRIYIDPKISMFLIGSEMVYKNDDISAGFDFINPNEKGRCGCGESFNV